jgi:ribonuclease HI
LKINIDGAFREEEKDGAWGFVIRDCDGHGVLAGSGKLAATHDALSAEAEACLATLNVAMGVGISHVIVEIDSTNLVSALRSSAFDHSPGGVVFREVQSLYNLILTRVILFLFLVLVIISVRMY